MKKLSNKEKETLKICFTMLYTDHNKSNGFTMIMPWLKLIYSFATNSGQANIWANEMYKRNKS